MKIKKIITALGNPNINFNNYKDKIEIVCQDIQYREGIIEYLENNNKIDYILINDAIVGIIDTQGLINKIKEINNSIKIILISKNKGYKKIYRLFTEFKLDQIIYTMCNEEKIFNKRSIPVNNFFKANTKEGEIITILGPNGIGKSIFSITYASNLKDKEILIIDFDIINNSLHNLLGVKEYPNKVFNKIKNNKINENNFDQINISDFIIKTKFNVDLISGINLIFNSSKQSNVNRIKKVIKNIKRNYDLIIIDTSSECLLDYTKELIKISDQSIFISGANTLEIKKSQKLLEIYNKEWNIPKEKINIIFNKCTSKSIDDDVLKELFRKYQILGKIKLNDYYDLAINKNNIKEKQITKDIEEIKKRIIKIKVPRRKYGVNK